MIQYFLRDINIKIWLLYWEGGGGALCRYMYKKSETVMIFLVTGNNFMLAFMAVGGCTICIHLHCVARKYHIFPTK